MWQFDNRTVPSIKTPLPGPKARALLERDEQYMSPSYTRIYPLVCARGSGAVIEDVDGNLFLDCTAGIAVTAAGHCHPQVVAAIQDQASKLIHMSGTDFYYQPQIDLAQRLAELAPGTQSKRVFFTNSGAKALEAALKLARWHTGRSRAIAFLGAFHGRTYGAMSLSGSKLVHRRGFSPLVPDIHHVPFPRACTHCSAFAPGCSCVKEIEETLLKRIAPPEEVGNFRRADSGRGRLLRIAAGLPQGPARAVRSLRHAARRGRSADGHGPHGQAVRRAALGRRAGHHLPRKGDRQRAAARGDHCPWRRDGLAARQPRQHLRRQSRELPRLAGD